MRSDEKSLAQLQIRVRATDTGLEWGGTIVGPRELHSEKVSFTPVALEQGGEPGKQGRMIRNALTDLGFGKGFLSNSAARRRRLRVIAHDNDPRAAAGLAGIPFEVVLQSDDYFATRKDCSVLREIGIESRDRSVPLVRSMPDRGVRVLVVYAMSGTELQFGTLARGFGSEFSGDTFVNPLSWDQWLDEDPEGYDIVQIWCHGAPGVLNITGSRVGSSLDEIFDRIVDERPGFVLLRACDSASPSSTHPYGVAGALVERGIPAVVGFRGQSIYNAQRDVEYLTNHVIDNMLEARPIDKGIYHLTDTSGEAVDRLAMWSGLRLCAASDWIDADCRIWGARTASDTSRPSVVPVAPHRSIGSASTGWVVAKKSVEPELLAATNSWTLSSASHNAISVPPFPVAHFVLVDDGSACVVSDGRRVAVGVLRPDDVFGWWPSVAMPEGYDRPLAASIVGASIEVLLTGSAGHMFAQLDHGGALQSQRGFPLRVVAGSAAARNWAMVDDRGRLHWHAGPLAWVLPGATWTDVDGSSSENAIVFAAAGETTSGPVLHVVRSEVAADVIDADDPWKVVLDIDSYEHRWTTLPGNPAAVRVVRSLDQSIDVQSVAVDIAGEISLWQWDDLHSAASV